MRVLMIVQELNQESWLRGFIVGWVKALAKEVEHVHVLALELHRENLDLPPNVSVMSMGKERGYERLRELIEFYRGVFRVIRDVDVIFSHMTPRYVWLAAPLAFLFRKPQMLWFIHPRLNTEIRLATWFSRWIVTATDNSFPMQSPKVHALGHGIDTALFSPSENDESKKLILAVGRITPIKNHDLLLKAAALMQDASFAIVGSPAAAGDEAYQARLLRQRDELGLGDRFQLLGAMDAEKLVELLRQASLVTNLTPEGSFDKAALEAMLTATPLVTANPSFDELLGEHRELLHTELTPESIAKTLDALLKRNDLRQIGLDLRQRTTAAHGLDRLMRRIVDLIQ